MASILAGCGPSRSAKVGDHPDAAMPPPPISIPAPDASMPAPTDPVEVTVLDRATVSGVASDPAHQYATATVDLGPAYTWSNIQLRYELGSRCTTPPTRLDPGCDPWDRVTSVLVDGGLPASGPAPTIELLRAVTPFGGSTVYTADVTRYAPLFAGPRTFRVYISTYADPTGRAAGNAAGFDVGLKLTFTPGDPPRRVHSVVPLAFIERSTGTPMDIDLELPDGASSAELVLLTTGHGAKGTACGCCDEFCQKQNTVSVDGAPVVDLMPWRDDCASFCSPAQGGSFCVENPWGAPLSVRAPRAGWCPSDVVQPIASSKISSLSSGPHRVRMSVAGVEGYWRQSLTAILYR